MFLIDMFLNKKCAFDSLHFFAIGLFVEAHFYTGKAKPQVKRHTSIVDKK